MTRQQPPDPVDRARAFLDEGAVLPLQRTRIFILNGRHVDEAPKVLLAQGLSKQHRQKLLGIEPIGLHATRTPVDLDTRRINDAIFDLVCAQEAMQPKAVSARFVAARDSCRVHLPLCLPNPLEQALGPSRAERMKPWLFSKCCRPGDFPFLFAQLKCHE